MASNSFGSERRPAGKQFRDGTVGDALDDLYNDIDNAFSVAEMTGAQTRATLHFDVNPTAADTITIGNDTYEFLAAMGSLALVGNIAVLIGADPAATMANLQAAMAGAGTAVDDGLTGVMGVALTDAQTNGSELVRLIGIGANDATVICVDANGDEAQGLPAADIATTDGLSDAGDGFNVAALQAAAATATGSNSAVVNYVYDAETVVAGKDAGLVCRLPFLPRTHIAKAKVTGTGAEVSTVGVAVTYTPDGDGAICSIDISGGMGLTTDGSEDITVVFYE